MRLCEKFQMENIAKNTELHPRKVRKILDATSLKRDMEGARKKPGQFEKLGRALEVNIRFLFHTEIDFSPLLC